MSEDMFEGFQPLMDLDLNVLILVITVYITVGVFFVEGTYEIIKTILKGVFGLGPNLESQIKELENKREENLRRSRAATDEALIMLYEDMAREDLRKIADLIRGKKEIKWMNIILPAGIGMLTVLLFHPNTMFYWLPFGMINKPVEVLVTGVLFYRGSNLAHGGGNKVGSFFESLIGRVSGKLF